jgi:hypothetical protein
VEFPLTPTVAPLFLTVPSVTDRTGFAFEGRARC